MKEPPITSWLLYGFIRDLIRQRRFNDAGGVIIEAFSMTPMTAQEISAALLHELSSKDDAA